MNVIIRGVIKEEGGGKGKDEKGQRESFTRSMSPTPVAFGKPKPNASDELFQHHSLVWVWSTLPPQ